MSEQLKSCPFCGENAGVHHAYDEDGCYWAYVKCQGCGVRTSGKWISNRNDACPIFYAEVRDAWNRRTPPAQPLGVDALSALIREAGNRQVMDADMLAECICERFALPAQAVPSDAATWCVAQTAAVERMEERLVAYCKQHPGCGLGEVIADLRCMLTTEHVAPTTPTPPAGNQK